MSYLLDVNVLLYASDRASDRYERARSFVESCAAGPELLCLTKFRTLDVRDPFS